MLIDTLAQVLLCLGRSLMGFRTMMCHVRWEAALRTFASRSAWALLFMIVVFGVAPGPARSASIDWQENQCWQTGSLVRNRSDAKTQPFRVSWLPIW
jgi:hypothetical protein